MYIYIYVIQRRKKIKSIIKERNLFKFFYFIFHFWFCENKKFRAKLNSLGLLGIIWTKKCIIIHLKQTR